MIEKKNWSNLFKYRITNRFIYAVRFFTKKNFNKKMWMNLILISILSFPKIAVGATKKTSNLNMVTLKDLEIMKAQQNPGTYNSNSLDLFTSILSILFQKALLQQTGTLEKESIILKHTQVLELEQLKYTIFEKKLFLIIKTALILSILIASRYAAPKLIEYFQVLNLKGGFTAKSNIEAWDREKDRELQKKIERRKFLIHQFLTFILVLSSSTFAIFFIYRYWETCKKWVMALTSILQQKANQQTSSNEDEKITNLKNLLTRASGHLKSCLNKNQNLQIQLNQLEKELNKVKNDNTQLREQNVKLRNQKGIEDTEF